MYAHQQKSITNWPLLKLCQGSTRGNERRLDVPSRCIPGRGLTERKGEIISSRLWQRRPRRFWGRIGGSLQSAPRPQQGCGLTYGDALFSRLVRVDRNNKIHALVGTVCRRVGVVLRSANIADCSVAPVCVGLPSGIKQLLGTFRNSPERHRLSAAIFHRFECALARHPCVNRPKRR